MTWHGSTRCGTAWIGLAWVLHNHADRPQLFGFASILCTIMLVRSTGFEPATRDLEDLGSSAELRAPLHASGCVCGCAASWGWGSRGRSPLAGVWGRSPHRDDPFQDSHLFVLARTAPVVPKLRHF